MVMFNWKLGIPYLLCIFPYVYVTKLKMAPLRLYERQQSLATDGMGAHTGSRVSLGKFT